MPAGVPEAPDRLLPLLLSTSVRRKHEVDHATGGTFRAGRAWCHRYRAGTLRPPELRLESGGDNGKAGRHPGRGLYCAAAYELLRKARTDVHGRWAAEIGRA